MIADAGEKLAGYSVLFFSLFQYSSWLAFLGLFFIDGDSLLVQLDEFVWNDFLVYIYRFVWLLLYWRISYKHFFIFKQQTITRVCLLL